jgi:dipeptidyl aminopeptidase/acylaminoacyl peptidase
MLLIVVNRDSDIVIPTKKSIMIYIVVNKANYNTYLYIYPDIRHGFLNEYTELFKKHIELFLDIKRVV